MKQVTIMVKLAFNSIKVSLAKAKNIQIIILEQLHTSLVKSGVKILGSEDGWKEVRKYNNYK
jgi:hypothetical protein